MAGRRVGSTLSTPAVLAGLAVYHRNASHWLQHESPNNSGDIEQKTSNRSAGWRVGWALSTPDLLKGLAVYHGNTSYCAPSPLQHGLAVALGEEDGSFEVCAPRLGMASVPPF